MSRNLEGTKNPGTKAAPCPALLIWRKKFQSPKPSLSSKERTQAVTNQGSEGMHKNRKSSQARKVMTA